MGAFIAWLQRQRQSTRLAFILQIGSRVGTAIMALVWTPLLLEAMGTKLNGLWLSFQILALLGGMSDLGMGGAVSIRAGQMLGQKDDDALTQLLGAARSFFLTLALFFAGLFLALSPWLHEWLRFKPAAGTGSLTLLFALGAAGFLPLILSNYVNSLNYACGNLAWPVVFSFVMTQASLASHCLLARQHAPLWLQYVPYLVCSAVSLPVTWWFLRVSHRALAQVRPLRFNWREWLALGQQSFWIYFWSLGALVYLAADRLLINAGFDPSIIPKYHNNYKICELALFVVATASYVSMPKITRWLAAHEAGERTRGVEELLRLNRVQIFLTLAAVLTYLALNDWFIGWWIGREFRVDLFWQFAFALNLAVFGSAESAMQVAPRCAKNGMRAVGLTSLTAGLINLALSFVAMKRGSILGIAMATVVAQSFFSLWISHYVCKQLGLSWPRWVLRTWVAPIVVVTLAFTVRFNLPLQSWNIVLLVAIYCLLLIGVAAMTRITPAFVRSEWTVLRSLLKFKP